MHELGIASEAYRLARAGLGTGAPLRLAHAWIAVGELTAVEPDLLKFAWTAVTTGTPDEGCALEVEWCPARQVCDTCGVVPERAIGSWMRLCPHCALPLRIEGGEELDLLRVEAEPVSAPDEARA